MPRQAAAAEPHRWREEMRHDFDVGAFSDAGRVYDDATAQGVQPAFADKLLRARIFLKHDESKAVAFLIRNKAEKEPLEQRGRWFMYLATGYARMRDFERSDHHFEQASKLLRQPRDRALLAYHLARRMLLEVRVNDAMRHIEEMSVDRSAATKVDQELLRSFAFAHEENYHEEARSLVKTLKLIGERREEHLEAWFHAVENLAALARELANDKVAEIAKQEVDRDLRWPVDFSRQRFQSLKAVGWTLGLRGDALGCFRYLRLAERVAPNEAFTAIVQLDRAHFARFIGERTWSNDELAMAEATADGVDWNATGGDERVALLLLAESFAEIDTEKARFYIARYNGLNRIKSSLHLFAFDHRLDAMAAYARGVVELALGHSEAEENLKRAFTIFDDIQYDWRAGRTALALHRATGNERWLHLAQQKLQKYSSSWLGEELRLALVGRRFSVQLPPQQQRVFELLGRQKSTNEIARELGLSPHTIRNHLKAVFKAYGVNNRSALLAEAARRGELALFQSAADR